MRPASEVSTIYTPISGMLQRDDQKADQNRPRRPADEQAGRQTVGEEVREGKGFGWGEGVGWVHIMYLGVSRHVTCPLQRGEVTGT